MFFWTSLFLSLLHTTSCACLCNVDSHCFAQTRTASSLRRCMHMNLQVSSGGEINSLDIIYTILFDIIQNSHDAQVLGNVTYTEVVVSCAGLAALSAPKRTATPLSEDVAAVESPPPLLPHTPHTQKSHTLTPNTHTLQIYTAHTPTHAVSVSRSLSFTHTFSTPFCDEDQKQRVRSH